ncbi:hypothetical protein [Lacticaseibacillus zeae]|uniref:ABC transporter permease n=1 Tax=Lacticaseibacillus zeae subsp. silagei TaxID=3068307 RepID=A0ABD7Z9D5_LACZE|nr:MULTISPECIES: hypothetical protein [Lacticaseibacillus]MDE3316708.1 hypothetical protein [Lacticaseibacillus zeae]OFR96233.1 hypothetical protein HMPREF2861_08305 [Lactobacillus sp. HMSC068F07]WLV83501.1 hypothetical protein LACZS2_002743 [Lacticaseibacillus sp. NCIMB 15475]WLV86250.1 hypothetical protein LACZS1_002691 [Lacticaseibacillus sp. NCIMB 15474]
MYLTNGKKIVGFMLIAYFAVVTWVAVQVVTSNLGVGIHGDTPLTDFLYMQFGGSQSSVLFDSLTMMLLTGAGAFLFIYIKNNRAFYMVQQRIGYTAFLKRAVIASFLSAFGLSIITKLYELTVIIIAAGRLPSNVVLPKIARFGNGPFDDNTLLSFAIFVLLSSIGWGIYAIFIFAIGLFVRKNSIYIVLGAVLGIGLITGIALLGNLNLIVSHVLYVIFLPTLIAPGQIRLNIFQNHQPNVYISFLLAALAYAGMSWLVMQLWLKRRKVAE